MKRFFVGGLNKIILLGAEDDCTVTHLFVGCLRETCITNPVLLAYSPRIPWKG